MLLKLIGNIYQSYYQTECPRPGIKTPWKVFVPPRFLLKETAHPPDER